VAKTRASVWMIGITFLTVAAMWLLPRTSGLTVYTAAVQNGDLLKTILLSGVAVYRDEQPVISPLQSRITKVHVREGQRVSKGELLFSLDTSSQEAALAAVMQARFAQEKLLGNQENEAILALGVLSDLMQKENELKTLIHSSQIRAAQNGIMQNIYIREGEYAQAAEVLGAVRGTELCIAASANASEVSGVQEGAPAALTRNGKKAGTAVLCRLTAPVAEENGTKAVQQMVLDPAEDVHLTVGDRVTIELLCGATENVALIPIAAVSRSNEIWIVEDGRAAPVSIDISKRNADYVALPNIYAGKHVVLAPDSYDLTSGCAVKEGNAR